MSSDKLYNTTAYNETLDSLKPLDHPKSDESWFDKSGLTVLKSFPVLWNGWEMDNEWYLCERKNGQKVLVISDHEDFKIGSTSYLLLKIEEYKQVLAESEEIMNMLGE